MKPAMASISGSFIPRVVTAGVPMRIPLVTMGLRVSNVPELELGERAIVLLGEENRGLELLPVESAKLALDREVRLDGIRLAPQDLKARVRAAMIEGGLQ